MKVSRFSFCLLLGLFTWIGIAAACLAYLNVKNEQLEVLDGQFKTLANESLSENSLALNGKISQVEFRLPNGTKCYAHNSIGATNENSMLFSSEKSGGGAISFYECHSKESDIRVGLTFRIRFLSNGHPEILASSELESSVLPRGCTEYISCDALPEATRGYSIRGGRPGGGRLLLGTLSRGNLPTRNFREGSKLIIELDLEKLKDRLVVPVLS